MKPIETGLIDHLESSLRHSEKMKKKQKDSDYRCENMSNCQPCIFHSIVVQLKGCAPPKKLKSMWAISNSPSIR